MPTTNSPKSSSPSAQPQQFQQRPAADNGGLPGAGAVEQFKQRANDWFSQIEGHARETPSRSLLYALGIGYILARLPVFGILFSFVRLTMMALKPAVLVYLGTLAYRRIMDSTSTR